MEPYDVVIIGSGLGGLACGTILAKEGYKVCVIEKNKQIGGNLQTFVRDGVVFDSGVHYVGGLDQGQNLYLLFKYMGIMDKLKLRKLDDDVFDAILFDGDPVVYKYAQGYERFIQVLAEQFPGEEEALRKYCDGIKEVCTKFPLYNLRHGDYFDKVGALEIDTQAFLESITDNKKLQSVLAGTSLLYAGEPDKTPLYVHALVLNSYIESSWRFIDGGSQIARLLSRQIVAAGGKIITRKQIVKLHEEDGKIAYAEAKTGERYYGHRFISNVHPVKTMEMTDSDKIKKAFRTRLKSLENSISVFYVNVVLKPKSMKYVNHNYYYFRANDAWSVLKYTDETWPTGYALYYSASEDVEYAEGITLMTYMRFDEVEKWQHTFNTVSFEGDRGADYEAFKKEKSEKLFDLVEERFPGFKDCIQSYYTATPLSVRDYIGTDDGSLYGIVKDYREPMRTFISPRTKVPNLFMTGQNLNLHGVLGVSVSAVLTCSEMLGIDYILNKIRNA
ncbi:phytoene desaturase family protein [Pseudochryseolinea flava]|uniref:All-trans-retinol 13,14-reductase n=1 Tax=Pseudochryseolinea flava TaxID=2059302 RepID=A0A364Y307_9BACT|nr:NAD(P)/FAD-dependent oxidoreductase [Pseudochryseolinea flava]RAW00156.1 all-trans-retinol 13,14-reductase [Pseudochryseolinea flava]